MKSAPCVHCGGNGSVPVPKTEPGRFGKATHLTCPHCGGSGSVPSDPAANARLERRMQQHDIEQLAAAICTQVAKFSDRRLNDGDDVWREREIEYRRGIAETANAICVAFQLDAKTFATACGLYVSNGRDSYSDCHPGELTWEKPWEGWR